MPASLPCMSKICLLLMHLPSVLDHFLVSFSFMACPIWGWALLDSGLCFFFSPPFFLLPSPTIPLYHSYCEVLPQFGWASLGLLFILPLMAQQGHWFFCYITSGAPMSHLFSLGRPGPVCFLWASSALFLTLHYHGLLLNSLGFPGPITLFLILGVHGLALNPYLSLLSLL